MWRDPYFYAVRTLIMSRYDIANGVKVSGATPKKSIPFRDLYGFKRREEPSKGIKSGLSKEQLCLRISEMILGSHSERRVVQDQAVTLMHIPEPELQAMHVRLRNSRRPSTLAPQRTWDDL